MDPRTQGNISGSLMDLKADTVYDYPEEPQLDLYLLLLNKITYVDCLVPQRTRMRNAQYRRIGYLRLSTSVLMLGTEFLYDGELFLERSEAGTLGNHEFLGAEEYVKDLRDGNAKFRYRIEVI